MVLLRLRRHLGKFHEITQTPQLEALLGADRSRNRRPVDEGTQNLNLIPELGEVQFPQFVLRSQQRSQVSVLLEETPWMVD